MHTNGALHPTQQPLLPTPTIRTHPELHATAPTNRRRAMQHDFLMLIPGADFAAPETGALRLIATRARR